MKTRKQTIGIALIVLAVYNIIAFLLPVMRNTTFWVAYGFTNASILMTGLVILGALDIQNIKGKFENMPIVYVAITYFVLQCIIGFVEIYYPMNFRYSILINVVLLGLSIIGLLIVNTGKKEIERVETKVQEKVLYIRELQADLETVVDTIADVSTKKTLQTLIETVRFSDPMSHSQLSTIENQIQNKVQKITQIPEDTEQIKKICEELQLLFVERNRKAKLYKNQPEPTREPQKPLNFKVIVAGTVSVLTLIGISVTVYFTVLVPNQQYDEAMRFYSNKQYKQAQEAFKALGDYKDSQVKQKEVLYAYATELLEKKDYANAEKEFEALGEYQDSEDKKKEAVYQQATEQLSKKEYAHAAEVFLGLGTYKDAKNKVIEIYNLFGESDVIYFGKYNGTPMTWSVVETKEDRVLLITNEPVDAMAYNTEYKATTWDNSSIRKWLNEAFYNGFDESEKARILTRAGETDKVFLLDKEAIETYTNLKRTNRTWWLSTNGEDTTKAMFVREDGTVNTEGEIVTKLHGVRPAIWLNLDT